MLYILKSTFSDINISLVYIAYVSLMSTNISFIRTDLSCQDIFNCCSLNREQTVSRYTSQLSDNEEKKKERCLPLSLLVSYSRRYHEIKSKNELSLSRAHFHLASLYHLFIRVLLTDNLQISH